MTDSGGGKIMARIQRSKPARPGTVGMASLRGEVDADAHRASGLRRTLTKDVLPGKVDRDTI
jgi:hypothetical protein